MALFGLLKKKKCNEEELNKSRLLKFHDNGVPLYTCCPNCHNRIETKGKEHIKCKKCKLRFEV